MLETLTWFFVIKFQIVEWRPKEINQVKYHFFEVLKVFN